jgi:hypothetical protein
VHNVARQITTNGHIEGATYAEAQRLLDDQGLVER